MNTSILFSAIAFCFMLVAIEAYSKPNCSRGCSKSKRCPELPECKCGTYKDACGCCSYCLKCPGEQCSLVAREKCANETTCKPPPGANALQRVNGPGRCI